MKTSYRNELESIDEKIIMIRKELEKLEELRAIKQKQLSKPSATTLCKIASFFINIHDFIFVT